MCNIKIFVFNKGAPDWRIGIESRGAVIDAYSHGGVDFSSYSRCGCKSELDFINHPVNTVSLAFKAQNRRVFRRRAFRLTAGYANIHPARAPNTRACESARRRLKNKRNMCAIKAQMLFLHKNRAEVVSGGRPHKSREGQVSSRAGEVTGKDAGRDVHAHCSVPTWVGHSGEIADINTSGEGVTESNTS